MINLGMSPVHLLLGRKEGVMNWEAVSAISGILAAIAVMLTVVYLAIQVRKNTLAWLDPFVAFQAASMSAIRSCVSPPSGSLSSSSIVKWLRAWAMRSDTLIPAALAAAA